MSSEIATQLIEQFVKYLEAGNTSKLTVKNYKADIRQFVHWFETVFEATFNPQSVTTLTLNSYKDYVTRTKNLSQRSLERYVSSLRKFFFFLKLQNVTVAQELFEAKQNLSVDPWNLKPFREFMYVSGASGLTIKNYIMDVRQFLSWTQAVTHDPGEWEIDKRERQQTITNALIEEYKIRLLSSGFSATSINRKLSSIRKYLEWQKKEAVSTKNLPKQPLFDKDAFLRSYRGQIEELRSQNTHWQSAGSDYSRFPPKRLLQKTIKALGILFDSIFVIPLSNGFFAVMQLVWRAGGKSAFYKTTQTKQQPIRKIENIKKEWYAPAAISIAHFPIHKKLLFHLIHTRPNWYKRYHKSPAVHYLHVAILFLFCCVGILFLYNKFSFPTPSQSVLGTEAKAEPRTIIFKARLTDPRNIPITSPSDLRVAIYNSPVASGSALIWQDALYHVVPRNDGVFIIELGKNTMLPQSLFTNSYSAYLGITIGTGSELTPREALPNTSLASNSQTLLGLSPITSPNSGTTNVVLALDSSGNLTIGGTAHPVFSATGGEFKLQGSPLTLATNPGTSQDVVIAPDGSGMLDIQKPIHNTSNHNNVQTAIGSVEVDDLFSVLATSDATAAFTINQNGNGKLLSAYSNSTAKFSIDATGNAYFAGNVGIGTDTPLQSLEVKGNVLLSNSSPTLYLGTKNYIGFDTVNTIIYNTTGDIVVHPATASSFRPFTDNVYSLGNTTYRWNSLAVGNGSSSFDGKVGVGTQSPASQLSVLTNAGASIAATRITNLNTTDSAENITLSLALGTAGNSKKARFVQFFTDATSQTDGMEAGRIRSNGGVGGGAVAYESGAADFAEYFEKAEPLAPGDIVELNENKKALKATHEDSVIGVVSKTGAFIGNLPKEGTEQNSVVIGLLGQLPVRVSTESGNIEPNDLIALSSIPGVGKKATERGRIIGRAMESFDGTTGITCAENPSYRCTQIKVLVNVSWSDPDVYLTGAGNLNIVKSDGGNISHFSLLTSLGQLVNRIGAFSQLIVANLETGKLVSPIAEIDRVHTNIISPIEPGSSISVSLNNSKLSIFNSQLATGSAVASIDNAGNATFSGQVNSSSLLTNEASISGTLHAGRIIADEIVGLNQNLNQIASPSSTSSTSSTVSAFALNADFGQFNQGLISLGPSGFTDLTVTNQLSVGSSLILSENAMNTLGSPLQIQNLKQSSILFEGGLVSIDTEGNLKVLGNASFGKNVSINGTLTAHVISPIPDEDLVINLPGSNPPAGGSRFIIHNSSGSAVFAVDQEGNLNASGSATINKLNLSLVAPAFATSNIEAVATGSAGTANIKSHQVELTIKNPGVTENSLIYITPIGTPSGQIPFLERQNSNDSFTVGIEQPAFTETSFNWLIIN